MKTENIKCRLCNCELNVQETETFHDDTIGDTTFLVCPNCGTIYECTEVADSEKQNFKFYQNGEDISGRKETPDDEYNYCINCGERIGTSSNFMLSDIDDSLSEDDDKLAYFMMDCPHCGMTEIIFGPSEKERESLPFYQKNISK